MRDHPREPVGLQRGIGLGRDPTITAKVLSEAGFDPAEMMTLSADPEVKAKLRSTTEEAVARGAYGAPTMFVGDEMFFGQDRLDFVAEELARA